MSSGADVHLVTSRQDTALHWASKFSNEQVVRCLLDYHADVNAVNSLEYTPLCGNIQFISDERSIHRIAFHLFRGMFLWKFRYCQSFS